MKNLRILLVEDDEPLAEAIVEALRHIGWSVETTARGEQLAPTLKADRFDAAILDINLPGIDGFTALQRVQQARITTPILVLSARDALEDRLKGLEGGADDYMLKPFALSELIARLRVLVRRHSPVHGRLLEHGPLLLDRDAHTAQADGASMELSRREWLLLELLMVNDGRVVPKEDIIPALSEGERISDNSVEVYVFRLRAKLEPIGVRLRTVRGFGYLLEPWHSASP